MYDTIEYVPLTDVLWVLPDDANASAVFSVSSTLPADAGPVYSSLHLPSLLPADSGIYAVTVANDAGNTTVDFTITVLPGMNAYFISPPHNINCCTLITHPT